MLIAKNINPEEVEVDELEAYGTVYGRNFAHSNGVAGAVQQAAKEAGDGPYTAVVADNGFECKKQLMLLRAGKFNADILEGMNCSGGCIAGPACISDPATVRGRMAKENMACDKKTIQESIDMFNFRDFDIELDKKD